MSKNKCLSSGSLSLGCNYWASHSGTNMWKNWQPEVIQKDFELLVENGISVIRIFPLWPDFQPPIPLLSGAGCIRDFAVKYIEDATEHP
ncbi:MAG: hypothetical protein JKY51_09850, partial [Opitutaceae bacterium]|nr:hypothetical protein [Opitutaceae bacterium]